MIPAANDVLPYSFGLAFAAYGLCALYLLASGRLRGADQASVRWFAGALVASAGWAGISILTSLYDGRALVLGAMALDVLRYALWFGFLLSFFQRPNSDSQPLMIRALRAAAVAAVLAALLPLAREALNLPGLERASTAVSLLLPVLGLLMVEQLFRNIDEDSRWNAKPVCLGLACVFAFDIYLLAEALLFGHTDPDTQSARGAVHALAVPFLLVAARRGRQWTSRLHISRRVAFYSATLVLAGGYLTFMAAVGYYVRFFGGDWGRALQVGLLVAGLAFLVMLGLSGSLRSRLRVFVGKNFFSYRFDYREEWLRFTAMLAVQRSPAEMGESIVRGLAKMVECPGGSLWTRGETGFQQTANWNLTPATEVEPASSSLCTLLREKGWVIDLDEFRDSPRRYGTLALPAWLIGTRNSWLVVPLLAGEELLGFAVLARPLATIRLDWEVLDLLKTAARQAAGYMAQMQATEALLEARKFDAFNRMSAFVVHDLKNIVTQLSLMLKNAERLHDNPEFQQDMLFTVQSSLEKMKRLMLQLREGAAPPGSSHGVELVPILLRLQAMAAAQGRRLEIDKLEPLFTRGHDDRLERVFGHLVQNALDATPPEGRVWASVTRQSGQVRVEMGDTGSGMSAEFIRTRLFRPFASTKPGGMGIGTYESLQYVRELGGNVEVDSAPGSGTVVTILLPIFEIREQTDSPAAVRT
jgi:putative PEP-CTERM system histidine kinase